MCLIPNAECWIPCKFMSSSFKVYLSLWGGPLVPFYCRFSGLATFFLSFMLWRFDCCGRYLKAFATPPIASPWFSLECLRYSHGSFKIDIGCDRLSSKIMVFEIEID